MRREFTRFISFILAMVLVLGLCPQLPLVVSAEEGSASSLEGKTISILGDSISTYTGVSNSTAYNSTIGSNAVYYSAGTLGVYREDTWWQQTIDALGLELLVNNSWSGSCVLHTRSNTVGAHVDRCVQLHNDHTGEEPDIILVFLGTNDFSYYQSTLGTADIDYSALITDNGDGTYTYAAPATTCEAYAIMLHKMSVRYPDAEIYCMSLLARRDPDYADSYADVGQPTAYNAEMKQIVEHFGAAYIDLESVISKDSDTFDLYIGDKRVHPNALGMDKMTQAVVSALLGEETDIYSVAAELTNVSLDGSRLALAGKEYTAALTATNGFEGLTVTVTMGGEDVTAQCYSDGKITISSVTGDIAITASALEREPKNFRWEYTDGELVSAGDAENALTKLAGTTTDGVFADTRYQLEQAAILRHDLPWVVEWKGEGSGGFMLAESSSASEAPFFFRRAGNYLNAFGDHDGSQYNNYGLALDTTAIDGSAEHVYTLENRIADDGSNMVYLAVDGVEVGPLNHYYVGGTAKGTTGDWISGKDFWINHIGTISHPLTDYAMEYLQIWEGGTDTHYHSYGSWKTIGSARYQYCECGAYNTQELNSYRWELDGTGLVSVGETENALSLLAGTVEDGVQSSTRYQLGESVALYHDSEWVVEWKAGGNWSGMLLTSTATSATAGMNFLFRTYNSSGLLAFGEYSGQYNNYGVALADLDMTAAHTYRIENRIASDGSNMAYLYVDGVELGAMNNYYIGGTNNQNKTVDWISGKDFVFEYLGSSSHPLKDLELEHLQIWEGGEPQIEWESGTIASATGLNNTNTTRLRTADYLLLSDYGAVDIGFGYTMTAFAYDADKAYLGTTSWLGSGVMLYTDDLLETYPTAVYFRVALRSLDSAVITVEDIPATGVTFYAPGEEVPAKESDLKYEDVGSVGSWQDGAIYDGKLFVLGGSGTGAVYDLETLTKLGSLTLDSTDVLKPHANSVCFGSTYYAQGDKYPLLYVNIYNNYSTAADRMEGTCCVYRVTETDGSFATELVQVIEIGFTEDLTLWKSKENNGDVRPYGNFLVDTEENTLYAYVMRDADKTTRFFCFALPALTEGAYSETYGCNVVTLESTDIQRQFDTEYFHYLQGGICYDGKIISAEGFNSGGSAEPALRIVDLETGTVEKTYYPAEAGLTKEPEVVAADPVTGKIYYAAADGVLRILKLDEIHTHTFTAATTAPTCTEQGYTTHTCSDCGDSFVDSYMDALGHSYVDGVCSVCGEEHPNAEPISLDDIAWENLTYRDIFITNNKAYVDGFNNRTFSPFVQNTGTNTITTDACYTGPYSLAAFGSPSQQLKSDTTLGVTGDYFVASKVYCTRYSAGTLGVCLGSTSVGIQSVTDDFVTASGIVNAEASKRIYIGSIHSADLDGYVDDPVVVNMAIFETAPTAAHMEALYENYVALEKARDREEVPYTEQEMLDAFVQYMNEKAATIGMDSSNFNDPVGMDNLSSASDILRLMVYADTYKELENVWGESTYTVTVGGENARAQEVVSTVIKPELEDYYHILGGKTGTLSKYNARNLAVILEIPGSSDRLAVVVLYADGLDTEEDNRYEAARQIANAALAKYNDPSVDNSAADVCCASAIACLIPAEGADLDNLQILYEKDSQTKRVPASITKVLTAICALDLLADLDETFTYSTFDTQIGSYYAKDFAPGDTLTYSDALYAMLLPSSNVTARAVARMAGEKLLQQTCAHQYESTTTAPTCTEQGYTTHTCSVCGDSYVDSYVDATGEHTPGEAVVENEGDHGSHDLVIYCTVCGEELSREHDDGYLPGDINGDGSVNNKDLTRLFQYLSGYDVEVVADALDVNGDGSVNNKDVTRLFQYLSSWDVTLH